MFKRTMLLAVGCCALSLLSMELFAQQVPGQTKGVNALAEPRLESVTLSFSLPKGDNKDDNTTLTFTIKKGDSLIASKTDFANGQEFNDPGEYGPFNMDVDTKVSKAVFQGSKSRLVIQPHGGREHDTVIMNTVVKAKFTDGTVLTSESGVHRYENASSYEWTN